jgi:tetratricopeptide (TPR) repeat protein
MSLAAIRHANLLMAQHRFAEAEQTLRQALAAEPMDAMLHAELAECLLEFPTPRLEEAEQEADAAVGLGPSMPVTHHVRSRVLGKQGRFKEAKVAVLESIRLDPGSESSRVQLAWIELSLRQYKPAMEALNAALQMNPESAQALALRSIVAERLGRSGDSIESALATVRLNPENSAAHAALGQAYLTSGDANRAAESFREALRLDPESQWARSGMVDALNSKSVIFRSVFRFQNWMSRQSRTIQIAIVAASFLVPQLLARTAADNPSLATPILLLRILLGVFLLLTWIKDDLFSGYLRLHPFGKHLLDADERWRSSLVCSFFAVGVVSGLVALVHSSAVAMLYLTYWLSACMAVSSHSRVPRGWPRWVSTAIHVSLFGGLPLAIVCGYFSNNAAIGVASLIFGAGCFLYSFIVFQVAHVFVFPRLRRDTVS